MLGAKDRLSALEDKYASLSASLSQVSQGQALSTQGLALGEDSSALASPSAELTPLDLGNLNVGIATVSGSLSVLGKTLMADVGITGRVNIGLLTIDGLSLEPSASSLEQGGNASGATSNVAGATSNVAGASISTLSGPLRLQATSLGNLEMMGAKVVIDTQGNVKIAGSLAVTGDITSEGDVTARKFNLELSEGPEATVSGVLSAAAGRAEIAAGSLEVEVSTSALTEKSLIFATPENEPAAISASRSAETKFKIRLKEVLPTILKVNWWVIN